MSSDQGSERLGRCHNNGPNRAILLSRLIFLWRVRPDNVQGPTLPRKRRVISERCLLILFLYKWYEGSSHTEPEMKSLILKRSVVLRGHKTSISVEDAFWSSVKEIAASGQMSASELISAIDTNGIMEIYHRPSGCLYSTSIGSSSLTDLTSVTNARQFRG
jgi:hypothetical protein